MATTSEPVAVWAKRAAQLALAGIPGDWPAFSTDSLRMAKDMLPVVATEQRRRGLEVDQDHAAAVLDDAIAGRAP